MTSSVYLRWLTPMACTLLLAGCLASDTLDTSFDTLAAAREAGMVERGWIPGWVPEGAIALKEVHDVDNNTSAPAFELPPDVKVALPEGCLSAHYAETLPGPFERRCGRGKPFSPRSTPSSPVRRPTPASSSSECAATAAASCIGVPTSADARASRRRSLSLPAYGPGLVAC